MPSTLWSAPSSPGNVASLVTSSFTTSTLTDISPAQCLIPPGMLNLGTRVRIKATGTYIATTAASTIAFGFYMNQAGTVIGTTEAILAVTSPVTIAAISGGLWTLDYWGHMAAVSATTGTAASIVGHGVANISVSLTAGTVAQYQMPITAALCTVAQTATGLITYTEQNVMVGATVSTNTGLTSITTDELSCELLG